MLRCLLTALLILSLATQATHAARNLIIVNSTGETADRIDLDAVAIAHNVATLGLTPNAFLTKDSIGICLNSGSSDLYFYRLPEMSAAGSLFLGGGRNPYGGAWLNPDTVVVTNWLTSTISVVDVAARSLIDEYPVGVPAENINHPQGISIVGRMAYITMSCFNEEFVYFPGKIEVFDLDQDSTIARISVGLNPQGIRIGPDGYLYVVCTGNYVDAFGVLYRIDPATNQVIDSLEIGGQPGDIAFTRQGTSFLSAGGWQFLGQPAALPPKLKQMRVPSALRGGDDAGGLVYTVDLSSWTLLHGPANPIVTDYGVVTVCAVSDSSVVTCNYQDDTVTELDSAGTILRRFHTGDGPTAIGKSPDCFLPVGDVDGSGIVNIADAVHLIGYIFGGGPAPVNDAAGDADGNGIVNVADAVYIIGYIFGNGAAPEGCAD